MKINIIKIALALVAIIISSYVAITLPISEQGIPFTAQSLVVFICAAFLSPKEIAVTLCLYILLGIAGLPVFAEGTSGWSKLTGASGGFLWGFLVCGVMISQSYKKNHGLLSVIVTMILATIILFICGLGQLTVKFGFDKAVEYGLTPFWKMGLLKAFLAASVVFFTNSILNRDKKVRS